MRAAPALLGSVLAVSLLVAACGDGPGTSVQDAGRRTAVMCIDAEPPMLHPYAAPGEMPMVYETLTPTRTPPYMQLPDGTWTPTPVLAGEAELTADPMTLTYRIHPDATWSDGVAITARDSVFSWETSSSPPARRSSTTPA